MEGRGSGGHVGSVAFISIILDRWSFSSSEHLGAGRQLRCVDLHHSSNHRVPVAVIQDILKVCLVQREVRHRRQNHPRRFRAPISKIIPKTNVLQDQLGVGYGWLVQACSLRLAYLTESPNLEGLLSELFTKSKVNGYLNPGPRSRPALNS
jgi:hypothetical protein